MAKLICNDLSKIYDDGSTGIKSFNMDINFSGLGLLGRNGSGKTTFINLLLGLAEPSYGSFELDISKVDMRVVIDKPTLPMRMTIAEWMEVIEKIYGPIVLDLDPQTDLHLQGNWKIGELSTGQQRKVALLPIFYGKPKLIIIDEPSNFLDIPTRSYIRRTLREQMSVTGADIIISSHDINEIRYYCSHVLFLREGRLMNQIKLDQPDSKYFLIKSTNVNSLTNLFEKNGVRHSQEFDLENGLFKVEASDKLWKLLYEYNQNGDQIISLRGVDTLTNMIEGL